MQNKGKILYLRPKSNILFRIARNTWNPYKNLFYISIVYNLFLMILITSPVGL